MNLNNFSFAHDTYINQDNVRFSVIHQLENSLKTIVDLFRHSLSQERTLEPAKTELDFSTPRIVSRWELSCVLNTERKVYEQMIADFEQGEVFYDIGANIGFYTCVFSQEASTVHAFEPNPEAEGLLKQNLEKNSLTNIEIHETGLSDENGYRSLGRVPGKTALGMAKLSDEAGEIRVRTLDSILQDEGMEMPDMVKIDVEGHEDQVLEGMKDTIVEAGPILYIESHGGSGELERILDDLEYRYQVIDRRIEGNKFYRAKPDKSH